MEMPQRKLRAVAVLFRNILRSSPFCEHNRTNIINVRDPAIKIVLHILTHGGRYLLHPVLMTMVAHISGYVHVPRSTAAAVLAVVTRSELSSYADARAIDIIQAVRVPCEYPYPSQPQVSSSGRLVLVPGSVTAAVRNRYFRCSNKVQNKPPPAPQQRAQASGRSATRPLKSTFTEYATQEFANLMEHATHGRAYLPQALCGLPSSASTVEFRRGAIRNNFQAALSAAAPGHTFSSQSASPRQPHCGWTLEAGSVSMQLHDCGIVPAKCRNTCWANASRDFRDADSHQDESLLGNSSTINSPQSDYECHFHKDDTALAVAVGCHNAPIHLARLPFLSRPTLPYLRNVTFPNAQYDSGDSDGHYSYDIDCCDVINTLQRQPESEPRTDEGTSGRFSDRVDSCLPHLDPSSLLSDWINDIMSSPHYAVDLEDAPRTAHNINSREFVVQPVSEPEQFPVDMPRVRQSSKQVSTAEHEQDHPTEAGTYQQDTLGGTSGTGRCRSAALARYRDKRQRRKFGQCARYGLRKANADSRPRVGGRFVGRAQAAAIRASQAAAASASTSSS